jgi:hypothetical protein
MSADGPETFTETVATERGALIPAGSIEHYVNLEELASTELTTSWLRSAARIRPSACGVRPRR